MVSAGSLIDQPIRLKSAPVDGRARFSVSGLRRGPTVGRLLVDRLGGTRGIVSVAPSTVTGNVLVEFDSANLSVVDVEAAIATALGLPPPVAGAAAAPAAATRSGPSDVEFVNTRVPGRLRLHVPGLRRNPELERTIETTVRSVAGVSGVNASAWTGNVLVQFDATVASPERIRDACAVAATSPLSAESPRRPAGRPPSVETLPDMARRSPWHSRHCNDVLAAVGSVAETGLSTTDATDRLRSVGPNSMPEPAQPPLVKLVADQLFNAPTGILAVGIGLSVVTGGLLEAALIAGVVCVNAAVGAATERSGHRAIAALRRSAAIKARVWRDGAEHIIDADRLVPGDIVVLVAGDAVPADARVIDSERLSVEESALTGESRAVAKQVMPVLESAALADQQSMVHRGTTVVGGRGRAVVVATGSTTTIGQLHLLAAEAEAPPTPMEHDLSVIGRRLAIGASVVCAGIFGLGLLRGVPLVRSAEIAVSLGVAAIPEGLPALATSVLALASGRMRRRGTLIRSLGAAEALGSVTVVCADKTGTLTENRMAARELHVHGRRIDIGGGALAPSGPFTCAGAAIDAGNGVSRDALLVGSLCSDAELRGVRDGELTFDGSATEGALLVAAAKAGLAVTQLRAAHPRLDVRDRSDGRRHMVTVHEMDGRLVALMKGSPEEVLELCDRVATDAATPTLSPQHREHIAQVNADMAGRAMRVLALAHRQIEPGYAPEELAAGFTFLGLIGLVDPIRESVPSTIKALHAAGIRTVMITGDQGLTATAVAKELGLSRRGSVSVLEAGDLSNMDAATLRGLVRDVGIFARVTPEMKLAIVRALQANGKIVAMTGDGVNDGPALRAADVGVAMGKRGSELARELSDVVLSNDDFGLTVDAVEEGRLVRANVRRVVHYLLATNASEIWVVAGAVLVGLPSPLSPLQLLWLNLVTDIAPGLGLAVEPRDGDLMKQPPRDRDEPLVTAGLLRRILGESGAIALGALGAYGVGLARYGPGPIAQSMAFGSLMGAQLLHVLLARCGHRPVSMDQRPRNTALAFGVGLAAGLQAVALFYPPIRTLLGGAPLRLADLAISAAGAIIPIAIIEGGRLIEAAIRNRPSPSELSEQGADA